MEVQVERDAKQALYIEVREEAVHPQTAALGHAQRRLLPAIPVYLSAARMRGNAQHQQQNRGDIYRPEKEPQQP